jgi:hypothetical protein
VFPTFRWWHRFFGIERGETLGQRRFHFGVGRDRGLATTEKPHCEQNGSQSYNEKRKTLRHQVGYDVAIVFGQALFRAWYD